MLSQLEVSDTVRSDQASILVDMLSRIHGSRMESHRIMNHETALFNHKLRADYSRPNKFLPLQNLADIKNTSRLMDQRARYSREPASGWVNHGKPGPRGGERKRGSAHAPPPPSPRLGNDETPRRRRALVVHVTSARRAGPAAVK